MLSFTSSLIAKALDHSICHFSTLASNYQYLDVAGSVVHPTGYLQLPVLMELYFW